MVPRRLLFAVSSCLLIAVLAACGGEPPSEGRPGPGGSPPPEGAASAIPPTPEPDDGGFLLSSSFERPVCGPYWRPGPGCEFGVEGDVRSVVCDARTGARCLEIQRRNTEQHMGVLGIAPLPEGSAYVGAAHRVPEIPEGAIPARTGYIELTQITPSDGQLPGWPVEVRLHADRRISLAGFEVARIESEPQAVVTGWRAPVDEWFYLVLRVTNGVDAEQALWVYDDDDDLVAGASLTLTTRREWGHATRVAQKVGGVTSTTVPMVTYADDWYVAEGFHGPLRVGPDGKPLG
jgi:hypothetical protein